MFDFVIVGAGSAGCVLANRLSANGQFSVCLLEAGGSDRHPLISTPLGLIPLMSSRRFNWRYESAAEKTLNGRQIFCPRGKALGGSSSINGMIYIRGHAADYDRWVDEGAKGWSYQQILPFFKRAENHARGADAYHGADGPLTVSESLRVIPFNQLYIDAATELGYPQTQDFNGEQQEGVGYYDFTIKNGRRWSAADAYIHPVKHRPNLTIISNAHASKIIFKKRRAVGVSYLDKKGSICRVNARREVILSAGAFNTPQLLMLSGIGPAKELRRHQIKVKATLNGVGKNLQEHVDAVVVRNSRKFGPLGYTPRVFSEGVLHVANYLLRRQGNFSTSGGEAGGFFKSSPDELIPDLQWHFMPARVDDHGRDWRFLTRYGYSCHVTLLRPKSQGQLTLKDTNPRSEPHIELNMLSDKDDVQRLIRGIRLTRELLCARAFDDYLDEEVFPGEGAQSDEELEDFLRAKANHIYHPVGSCAMGSGPDAVVDAQLRVHELQGLRIADASVMPSLVGGNTNAPTIMIAEKAADMILRDHCMKPIQTDTTSNTQTDKEDSVLL